MHRYTNDTRFVSVGIRKCASLKVQNTLQLSKVLYSKYARECTSINNEYTSFETHYQQYKHIIWTVETVYYNNLYDCTLPSEFGCDNCVIIQRQCLN